MDDHRKKSSSSLMDKLILPIIVAIIAGVILLYLEHNTDIFSGKESPQTYVISISIKELTFCEPQFFDETNGKYIASQQAFSLGINKIFISWVYSGNYSGEYSRLWYRNGGALSEFRRSDRMWGFDGQRDYTFVSYRNGFTAGEYLLEFRLNLDNRLIYSAGFTVQ